jgi:predicted PolB exonuclease-like 3'-5' exonuclease
MEFVVFDIETRVDKRLLNRVFFARDNIGEDEAFRRFSEELNNRGTDFFPLTLHVPISIAFGQVGSDYVLRQVETLKGSYESEESLVRDFWMRLEHFRGCLISFNGRHFDLPVLELAALRWGISAPRYFDRADSPRSADAHQRHLDLFDYLTNSGEFNLRGGLDLLLKMLELPGKQTMSGAMVQEYYDSNRHEEIHRYCRTDVIQTYLLFLRVELMRGRLDLAKYQAARSAATPFLEELYTGADGPGAQR